MSRILFVVPPFAAHVNPTVSIGAELALAGHECAWVTYAELRPLLAPDARVFTVPHSALVAAEADLRRAAAAPWLAGMQALFERILVPIARDMMPVVDAAVTHFRPDVVVADHQAIAGALIARKRGTRWVTSAPSAALLRDRVAQYPAVAAWIAGLYAELERSAGLAPIARPDLSADLVLIYTSRYLAGEAVAYPASYRFVGPTLSHRRETVPFPWERLTAGKTLLVSFGTLFAERARSLYARLLEALHGTNVTVVVGTQPDLLPDPPENFVVRAWLPLMELLPRADAMLCHAGVVVNEALSFGVPAVVAPMAHEQAIYAELVVGAGAGVRVRSNRVSAPALRDAIFTVLDGAGFRAAAQRVALSFREAGGAPVAARAIAEVAQR